MSMNRNAMPWGVASLGLGISTLVGAVATIVVWTAMSGDGPLLEPMSLVAVLGIAAVVTGVRARRTRPDGAAGSGLALAGILTGSLAVVATVGWIALSVAFVLALYLFAGLAFALSGVELAGSVLGAGL
jgi:hypothetical protein